MIILRNKYLITFLKKTGFAIDKKINYNTPEEEWVNIIYINWGILHLQYIKIKYKLLILLKRMR